MLINLDNIVSISDANRNFSQVARKVDEDGPVVIMKNNKPRYIVTAYHSTPTGGIAMRKLRYRRLTTAQDADYYGLRVEQSGEGIKLNTTGLTDELASRQTRLFQAYVAIYASKKLGLAGARSLLSDEGESVALETLRIPKQEDSKSLFAIWFCQVLLADSDRKRVIALYNAYGALPGGYKAVEEIISVNMDQKQAKALIDTVNAERYDEGDLAEKAGDRQETAYQFIDFEAHLRTLAESIT